MWRMMLALTCALWAIQVPKPVHADCAIDCVSRAIGRPDRGRLEGAVAIREHPGLFLRAATRKHYGWGTTELIAAIRAAADHVQRTHPDAPPVVVGHLSRRDGGRLSNHVSHQTGLDVDIGYIVARGGLNDFGPETAETIDLDRTWTLLDGFIRTGRVQYVFTDARFIPGLRRAARRAGLSPERVAQLFRGVIRHEPHHDTHLHVRIRSAGDACIREAVASAAPAKARQAPARFEGWLTRRIRLDHALSGRGGS